MNEEVKQLNEELVKIQNAIHSKMEKDGEKVADLKGQVEKMKEEVQAREDALREDVKKVVDGFASLEAKAQQPAEDPAVSRRRMQADGVKQWFARDWRGVKPESVKTLTAEDDPQAGYLVLPPYFEKEIIDQAIVEVSPIRSLAAVRVISTNQYDVPAKTAHAVSGWVADGGTTTADTTLAYGLESIPVHECTVLYQARQTLLDDAAFNIEAELRGEFGDSFGLLEGTAFVTGTGIGQPEGFTANATVVANYTASGTSGAVTASGTMELWGALKTPYVNGAVFVMRRATIVDFMQLTHGDGTYMLNRLGDTPNWQLLGHRVVECPDMPAVAANAYSVAFANFKRGYRIIDRKGITVIRDPYSNKTGGVVDFMATRRVGGAVVNPEAIKLFKLADS